MVSEQDIPAEAVEAVRTLFACRCDPAWTERKLHAPDCIEELGDDVLDIFAAALPHLRERWLAEVEEALWDGNQFYLWWGRTNPVRSMDRHMLPLAADYLRDVLGAGADGEGDR